MRTEGKYEVFFSKNYKTCINPKYSGLMIDVFGVDAHKEDAEFICLTVNNHDKLVEALKEINNNILPEKLNLPICYQIRETIEQVLKEVEG